MAAALFSPDGGGGAELRGHIPDEPAGVVLVLHGGADTGHRPVTWAGLAVLRMLPFAVALRHRAGSRLAVVRLKYRVKGWNGIEQDPVHDARWALERIRRILPGAPVALVGHSMGGRVALQLAGGPRRRRRRRPGPVGRGRRAAAPRRGCRCSSCTAPATG